MTVCIAAIADRGDSVVAITDSMLSVEGAGFTMTADNNMFVKGGGIHPDWIALFAGSTSLPIPIISEARKKLGKDPINLPDVVDAFLSTYKKHLAKRVADEVLPPGFDIESFYECGLEKLGEMGFTEKRRDFEFRMQSDPIMEFLVYGFDQQDRAHIFTVKNPGTVTYHDNEGFWAIGSGQQVAVTALMLHEYNQLFPMSWSIYHICEAKFMAEKALGVGKESFLLTRNKKAGFIWYPAAKIDEVRSEWISSGKPQRPISAIKKIDQWIADQAGALKSGGNALGFRASSR